MFQKDNMFFQSKKPNIKIVILLTLIVLISSIMASVRIIKADGETTLYLPVIKKGTKFGDTVDPIVFVSRQIPERGSVYWDEPRGMAGVGTYSRFQVASPGKLIIREPNGDLRTLIDGENPSTNSLHLIDVNAPDVSYDGSKIVFAGFPDYAYSENSRLPTRNPGGWRIYTINVDGTGLQQITLSDLDYNELDMSQFGGINFRTYDDTDPVWLPDGRIVFSTTRWPSFAQYSGARTSNLYVVNDDGSNLHRITSERNGADRPVIDPITGQIVFSRWWRNFRMATNDTSTILGPENSYLQHDGLTTIGSNQVGFNGNLFANFWQIATINPDGTDLARWGGSFRNANRLHYYGGDFAPNGDLIANYFPMSNMTEAAGFGGLRRFYRGPNVYEPIIGVADFSTDYVSQSPPSFGILKGNYAAEPAVMDNGWIILSWAEDIYQDYGLYMIDEDGSSLRLIYDNPDTAELRARLVRPRSLPPILPDTVTQVSAPLPPSASGPYDAEGTFVFDNFNVYFNAPVDFDIVNAPAVGSADTIRFFIDHQRTNPGSFEYLDWPILLNSLPINPNGSVIEPNSPANVPLFEQIRSSDNTVPVTLNPDGRIDGATHVTGMNYGRPGTIATCVGCHAGHTMIPIPENREDALWTNLAPGAQVTVSSSRDDRRDRGVIDRWQMKGRLQLYWSSAYGQTQDQWVQLTFQVPVTVRTVRLYNPRQEAESSIQVNNATVKLFADANGTIEVGNQTVDALSVSGTDVAFNDVKARVVRVEIDDVTGLLFGNPVASLGEIEVIARGEAP